MGLATQIHWSHEYSFSIAVRSVCEHFNTFTGVFVWQWTVEIETKNHLQNFHMWTSKSHFEHLWMCRDTLFNTLNACKNRTKIDFCLQCSLNLREVCNSLKSQGTWHIALLWARSLTLWCCSGSRLLSSHNMLPSFCGPFLLFRWEVRCLFHGDFLTWPCKFFGVV